MESGMMKKKIPTLFTQIPNCCNVQKVAGRLTQRESATLTWWKS